MEIKTINELNQKLLEKYNQHKERVLGRYNATDIYKIKKGELRPDNFFEDKPIDMNGLKNLFRGYAYENQLLKEFIEMGIEQERNGDDQLKIEYKINDEITLVMKPDFVLPKVVLETKAPNKLKDKIPPWYLDQCEVQYRLLNKKIIMTLINTAENEYPLLLGIEYVPSEERWKNIQNVLIDFHNKLKLKWKNNS
jgi:hypothetical protein